MPGKKPTHTGRDATKEATGIKHEISIHAPHTGRDTCHSLAAAQKWLISIHAPHTGRDCRGKSIYAVTGISIHAPHAGRD